MEYEQVIHLEENNEELNVSQFSVNIPKSVSNLLGKSNETAQSLERKASDDDSFVHEQNEDLIMNGNHNMTDDRNADRMKNDSTDTGISSEIIAKSPDDEEHPTQEPEYTNGLKNVSDDQSHESEAPRRKVTMASLQNDGVLAEPDQSKRSGIKLSLADITRQTIAMDTSDEGEDDDDDIIKLEQNVEVKNELKNADRSSNNIWQQLANRRRMNKISQRPGSDDRNLRSARQIRTMRKKVSVNSKGKKKTVQEDLALAVVVGDVTKVEDIVDAYVGLYQGDGLKKVISYRYDIDPRTFVISCVDKPLKDQVRELDPRGPDAEMFLGLSVLHIACAFDQEQVLQYFFKYGGAIMKTVTTSGQSLVHTCAWFGTAAPLQWLLSVGSNVWVENLRKQNPLHLSVTRGHVNVTKMLISAGADIDGGDAHGNTPLHEAVKWSHFVCAQELINHDAEVDVRNESEGTPLHYATNTDVVTLLLAHGADPNAEMDDPVTNKKSSAFHIFLHKMPEGCTEVFNKNLSYNGKSIGAKDLEVSFSYDLFLRHFDRDPHLGEGQILLDIVEVDHRELLKHPVCESFLDMKWSLVKNFFNAYLIFYCLFLVSVTALIILDYSPWTEKFGDEIKDVIRLVCGLITYVSLFILGIKNIFLMSYTFKLYFNTMQNFNELIMILSLVTFIILNHFKNDGESVVHFAALSLFFAWFNFSLLLGKLPFGGIYINMVVGITKDVITFMTLYTSTLIAFGLGFHVINSSNSSLFADPISSILCALAMMVGEIGFADAFTAEKIKYHGTTEIFFVFFLLLVSIIIMNLLVGLAINNITSQFQSAGVYRLKMTVLLMGLIEDVVIGINKVMPCIAKDTQLFKYFLSICNTDKKQPDSRSLTVYIYPNETKNVVFVKNGSGQKVRTKFVLPPWIMANTFKILKASNGFSSVQAATEKRQNDERLNKISSELNNLKKDINVIKNDLQSIVNMMKLKKL